MWQEFKEFISRGSVLDLAIGIVIGAAFGRVVTSFVNDLLMPPIGLLLGRANFSGLFVSLNGVKYASLAAARAAGAPTINYGAFINTVIEFLIIGFAVFLVVKSANQFRKPVAKPAAPAAPSNEEKILTDIRDLLSKRAA